MMRIFTRREANSAVSPELGVLLASWPRTSNSGLLAILIMLIAQAGLAGSYQRVGHLVWRMPTSTLPGCASVSSVHAI